jgi:acyl carrier protein
MILEDLKNFMLSEVIVDFDRKSLKPEEDLLEQGIIDSLGLMKLITFMEQAFHLQVNDEEIIPENFQCLNNMVKLIELKINKN